MLIETKRLKIRDLKTGDGIAFAEMATDGSLNGYASEAIKSMLNIFMRL